MGACAELVAQLPCDARPAIALAGRARAPRRLPSGAVRPKAGGEDWGWPADGDRRWVEAPGSCSVLWTMAFATAARYAQITRSAQEAACAPRSTAHSSFPDRAVFTSPLSSGGTPAPESGRVAATMRMLKTRALAALAREGRRPSRRAVDVDRGIRPVGAENPRSSRALFDSTTSSIDSSLAEVACS